MPACSPRSKVILGLDNQHRIYRNREKGWSFDGSLSSAPFKSPRVSTKTTRLLHEGPLVRIRLPPVESRRTIGSSAGDIHPIKPVFEEAPAQSQRRCSGFARGTGAEAQAGGSDQRNGPAPEPLTQSLRRRGRGSPSARSGCSTTIIMQLNSRVQIWMSISQSLTASIRN